MVRYSKAEPPASEYSTEVKLGIYVNSFFSISETSMDYSISFYLRQAWHDPRLTFNPIDGHVKEVKLPDGAWDQIWVPDVFFRNEKKANYHSISTPNRLLRLNSTGHIWYVSKITAQLACPMFLKRYPLDTQACPMMFESFGYTSDIMHFNWLDSPAQVDTGNEIPQFSLQTINFNDCTQNYTGGSFTCLQLDFVLKRDIGFFLLQVYIPSMMVVILSWVSFWINIEAIPARVSVGLITVLTMTTASVSANSSLPKVSYVKAIDVWMSMCLLFVFAALLEYSIVNVMSRSGDSRLLPSKKNSPRHTEHTPDVSQLSLRLLHHDEANGQRTRMKKSTSKPPSKNLSRSLRNTDPQKSAHKKALAIDNTARVLFPLSFFIFNLVYWVVYGTKNDIVQD